MWLHPLSRNLLLAQALAFLPSVSAFAPATRGPSGSSTSSSTRLHNFFDGAPSNPGFKPGQFEKLSSWATTTTPNRPVVTEYESDAFWLWTNWGGTTLEMVWQAVLFNVAVGVGLDIYAHHEYSLYLTANGVGSGGIENAAVGLSEIAALFPTAEPPTTAAIEDIASKSWGLFELPPSNIPFIQKLQAFSKLWEYQLSLVTFTIAFFTGQAYDHWRSVYLCARAIQGRINDICLLTSMAARRNRNYGEIDGNTGYAGPGQDYSRVNGALSGAVNGGDVNGGNPSGNHGDARKLVKDVARYARLSHTFFWAATPSCSDGFGDVKYEDGGVVDSPYLPKNFDTYLFAPKLMSPEGLMGLVEMGQLTQNERDALIATNMPPSQYSSVLLEWIGIRVVDAIRCGELVGGEGLEMNVFQNIAKLRGEYFNIGDYNEGRMPMAYIQLLQILIDTLVLLAPFALYPQLGIVSIFLTALLTWFYKGLLELSKSFLDPFGVDGFRAHNIRVDVLVSEVNFGAAHRWVDAGDSFPSELRVTTPEASGTGTEMGTGTPEVLLEP